MEFADILHQYITESGYSCHIQNGASWCETGRVIQIGTRITSTERIIHFYLKDERIWMKGHSSGLEDPGRKVVAKIIKKRSSTLGMNRVIPNWNYDFWGYGEKGFTVPIGTIHEEGILEKVLYLIPDKYLKQ